MASMRKQERTLEDEFSALRGDRAYAESLRKTVAEDTRHLVRVASEKGWRPKRITKEAGVSRQTVHEILRIRNAQNASQTLSEHSQAETQPSHSNSENTH